MKYLSVCSGIEAATCAWHPLGWTPVGFSEIEKFPSAVLAHHYHDVPNLGDMTRFQEWPDDLAPDLIVGGTPCQSFSVAGLRKGLADPRGNLALVYLAMADRYRPEWLVWENVPGVLSSNGGRDFGAFLGGLAELGYGFAYRVLDAQYFGVAQRRRRVFVVANLGDWRRAAAVLFERHSLWGHPAPRREKMPPVAALTANGVGTCGGDDNQAQAGHLVAAVGAYSIMPMNSGRDYKARETDVAQPVMAGGPVGGNQGGDYIVQPIAFGWQNSSSQGDSVSESITPTLDKSKTPAVAFSQNQRDEVRTMEVAGALAAQSGVKQQAYLHVDMAVRRLTPRECERLQGFPDDYTDIRPRGKDTPDGPRYKALGNSMAVPCMRWIGERIQSVSVQQGMERAV